MTGRKPNAALVSMGLLLAMLSATAVVGEDTIGIRLVTGPFGEGVFPVDPAQPNLSVIDVGDWAELTVIEETLSVAERNGLISVVGEVRNDGDHAIEMMKLDFAGLDADGELVAAYSNRDRIFGVQFADSIGIIKDVIEAGDSGIFNAALFPLGRPVETILISASGRETGIEPTDVPLEMVGDWEIAERSPGLTEFSGVVRNAGSTDLIRLSVTMGARDQIGKMLVAHRVYPEAERIGGYLGGLRAGDETVVEFLYSVDFDEIAMDSIETRLAARPYQGGRFDYGIAGVAHGPGSDGSVWRSSLGLTNRSGADGGVSLAYHHAGGRADAGLVLGDGESADFNDVVRSLFSVGGESSGYVQIGSTVPLTVSGRTANETPSGGFGQALPVYTRAMTLEFSIGLPGVLSILRGGPLFRTNIGLVNMADEECQARVVLFDSSGDVVADLGWIQLAATEWRQLNNAVPAGVDGAYATVEPQRVCPIWAYASVIENATGDPTTVRLVPGTEINLAPWRPRGLIFGPSWADLEPPPVP